MKRTIFTLLMLTLLSLASWAQSVPEGATLLYYSKTTNSGYGCYMTVYTLYEQGGTYYLYRGKGFSGVASPVKSKQDKIDRLPEATMELSAKQVDNLCRLLQQSSLLSLYSACIDEEQRNIASGYMTKQAKQTFFGPMDRKSCCEQVIEWPGVATGVNNWFNIDYQKEASDTHYQHREAYLKAVADFNAKLNDLIDRYVRKNISRLWKEYERGE